MSCPRVGLLVAIVGPVAVWVALVPFRDELAQANAALALVIVVLVAALVGGRIGGAVATIVAAVSFDFFFTLPYNSFTIDSSDDVETTVLLLVAGLLVGEIVVRSRRHQRRAVDRDQDLRRMQRFARLGAGGEPPGDLIHTAEQELVELIRPEDCWFERPPFPVTLPTVGHGRITVWGDESGVAALDPAPSSLVALPVFGDGTEQGRFVLELGRGRTVGTIDPGSRALAVALADRLGTALAHSR